MSGHEMRDTIARAICVGDGPPCVRHVARAADAMTALVLAGYLQTGGGAGETPPAVSAVPLDPAAQAGEANGTPAPSSLPRRFRLYRHEDPSGVSGTGWVAEGVAFTDGYAALRWFGAHPATVAWDNMESIVRIHGHNGLSEIRWLDGEPT